MVLQVATVAEFEQALASTSNLIVVDFFATWCGPCRLIAPKLQELDDKHENVTFIKVDVDQLGEIAQKYEIQAMPTLLFFKNGQVVETVVGAKPPAIIAAVEKHA